MLNQYIDHTLLKATASTAEIKNLCAEAIKYNFFAVCVNPYQVKTACATLQNTAIKICTVIGFPLGANLTITKSKEAELAIMDGADEIDMVVNLGAVKSKQWEMVLAELKQIRAICHDKTLKVIFETAVLTNSEIIKLCELSKQAKVDFIKTCTGFNGQATIEAVKLMKATVGNEIAIKVSGGIKTFDQARMFIELGASRLGTSASIAIVTQQPNNSASNY